MAGDQVSNSAYRGARVGMQIGVVHGPVTYHEGPAASGARDDLADQLAAQLEALRQAVQAALQREELTAEAAQAAQLELDAAAGGVPAAARGDNRGLIDRLHRVGDVLGGGLKVLAQLAAVVAAVKGIT
jgi:hypothetical protein